MLNLNVFKEGALDLYLNNPSKVDRIAIDTALWFMAGTYSVEQQTALPIKANLTQNQIKFK